MLQRITRVLSVLTRVVVCITHMMLYDSSHFLTHAASKPNADDSVHNPYSTIYGSNRLITINGYIVHRSYI